MDLNRRGDPECNLAAARFFPEVGSAQVNKCQLSGQFRRAQQRRSVDCEERRSRWRLQTSPHCKWCFRWTNRPPCQWCHASPGLCRLVDLSLGRRSTLPNNRCPAMPRCRNQLRRPRRCQPQRNQLCSTSISSKHMKSKWPPQKPWT